MSRAAPTEAAAPSVWRELLPARRRFVALPSARRPVIVTDVDRLVLNYVRTTLLAVPPSSALPDWTYNVAARLLRIPAFWQLLPTVQPDPTDQCAGTVAEFIATTRSRVVVLRHSRDPDPRTVLLLFGPGRPTPTFVAKIPAGSRSAALVLGEAERIDRLQALRGTALGATVPHVVDLLTHGGRPVLLTAGLPGTPMLVGYHRRGHIANVDGVHRDMRAANAWLAAMQAATAGPIAPLDLAPAVLDRLAPAVTDRPDRQLILDRVGELRSRLRRHRAPTTLVHGDFWPGNVLIEAGDITGVVDWEHSESSGNPVRDIARFALAYSAYLDRHTAPGRRVRGHPSLVAGLPGAGVIYALEGRGWYPDLVRGFLATGLTRLGVPISCVRDAVMAEVVALASEATDEEFARHQLQLFLALSATADRGRPAGRHD